MEVMEATRGRRRGLLLQLRVMMANNRIIAGYEVVVPE
jgi:hypothetical protein